MVHGAKASSKRNEGLTEVVKAQTSDIDFPSPKKIMFDCFARTEQNSGLMGRDARDDGRLTDHKTHVGTATVQYVYSTVTRDPVP